MSHHLHHKPYDGLSLDERDPSFIRQLMPIWEWFYRYYFRVRSDGWEYIPDSGKMLIVGSHNGGLASPDMQMLIYDWFRRFGPERLTYGLAHSNLWKFAPDLAKIAVKCGAVQAEAEMAVAALKRDAAVLVYPGGLQDVFRPHSQRHQIHLAGHTGFIKLALRENTPIIPVVSTGAHDTLFVLTDLYAFFQQLHNAGMPWLFGIDPEVFPIYLGLPWGIGIGPLPNIPLPTTIHLRICPPIRFKRYGEAAADDQGYVDGCYETVRTEMQRELHQLAAEVES